MSIIDFSLCQQGEIWDGHGKEQPLGYFWPSRDLVIWILLCANNKLIHAWQGMEFVYAYS